MRATHTGPPAAAAAWPSCGNRPVCRQLTMTSYANQTRQQPPPLSLLDDRHCTWLYCSRAARGHKGTKMKNLILAVTLLLACGYVAAHSGGTDRNGCHVDHKTGERHCH